MPRGLLLTMGINPWLTLHQCINPYTSGCFHYTPCVLIQAWHYHPFSRVDITIHYHPLIQGLIRGLLIQGFINTHGFTVYPVIFHHQQLPSGESKAPPPPRFKAALRMEASRLKPPEEAPGTPGWPWLSPKDEFEVRSHGVTLFWGILGILPWWILPFLAVFSILHESLMRSPQEMLLALWTQGVYVTFRKSWAVNLHLVLFGQSIPRDIGQLVNWVNHGKDQAVEANNTL